MSFVLGIATKTYSSWSLRAWLAARIALGRDFTEIKLFIAGPSAPREKFEEVRRNLLQYSPSGKVPVLIDGGLGGIAINESFAIILHLAERFPAAQLFPVDPAARAACFAACAEMHSGFQGIRSNLPHHCTSVGRIHGSKVLSDDDVLADVERLTSLWTTLRTNYGQAGPYLFGNFGAADCMYAPVALRFLCYDPDLTSFRSSSIAREYIQTIAGNALVQEWIADAKLEGDEWKVPGYEIYSDPK